MTTLREAYLRLVDAIGAQTNVELGEVHGADFQRFAYAVGDLDPRYVGHLGIAGGQDRHSDPVEPQAPPIFLSAVMGWGTGPAEAELRPDGSDPMASAGLPLEGLRLMGAGQDLIFHRPVRDGDRIERVDSIDGAEFKEGRSGELVVLTIRRDYRTPGGEPVLTCVETLIAR